MTLGALHLLIGGNNENFCCILLDRNITVVYWMGVQMFVERGIQNPSSQRYMDCSKDQWSFLRSKFTSFISSVKMDLGHLSILPPDSYHDVKLHSQRLLKRWSSRGSTLLLVLVRSPPASGAQTAFSSSRLPQCTQLLQHPALAGHAAIRLPPAPTADTAFQSDITLQGWSSPSSASRGPQWLLCYSLSHSCAISTKVWIPATEQSASSPLGGPGWWLLLVRAFSIFCRTIFVTKHSLFILIPCYSGFYTY